MNVQVAHHAVLMYSNSWQPQSMFNSVINGENSVKIQVELMFICLPT